MSIADYSDLLVQVSEYTGRDDFGHMFPRFVRYAEIKINHELHVADMETIATLTTAATGIIALPTGFKEMREVKDASTGRVIEAASLTAASWQFGPNAGTPQVYYIQGDNIQLVPTAALAIKIKYYTKVTALTVAVPTNWLLERAPMIYLYGVATEVMTWAAASKDGDPAKAIAMNTMFKAELTRYQERDSDKRYANARSISRGVNP